MKTLLYLALMVMVLASCKTKTTEVAETTDTVKTAVQAETRAPATLAFSQVNGYVVKNSVSLADSVNYVILASEAETNEKFALDKSLPELIKPDYTINYVFAVICEPTNRATTITIDKVEVGEYDINVYLNIQRGDKQGTSSKPTQLFAVERRDGFNTMQFFVNGKKSQVHLLNMMQ